MSVLVRCDGPRICHLGGPYCTRSPILGQYFSARMCFFSLSFHRLASLTAMLSGDRERPGATGAYRGSRSRTEGSLVVFVFRTMVELRDMHFLYRSDTEDK